MKLLKAPYGWPQGAGVRITRDATRFMSDRMWYRMYSAFRRLGCPHQVLAKLLSCLKYSGHYECRLSEERADHALEDFDLADLGIVVTILDRESDRTGYRFAAELRHRYTFSRPKPGPTPPRAVRFAEIVLHNLPKP